MGEPVECMEQGSRTNRDGSYTHIYRWRVGYERLSKGWETTRVVCVYTEQVDCWAAGDPRPRARGLRGDPPIWRTGALDVLPPPGYLVAPLARAPSFASKLVYLECDCTDATRLLRRDIRTIRPASFLPFSSLENSFKHEPDRPRTLSSTKDS